MSTRVQIKTNETRDMYFQMWRDICILIVVLMHCYYPPFQSGSFDGTLFFFEINLINFPVAIFFVLSGYFVKETSFLSDRLKPTLLSRTKKLYSTVFGIYGVLYGF